MYYNEVLMQVLASEVDGNDTMQVICESLEGIGFRAFGESLDNLAAVVKDENAQILVYRAIHNNSASKYVLHTVETLSIKPDSFGMIDVALALRSVEEIVGIGHHTHVDSLTFNKAYYTGPVYTDKQSKLVGEYDYLSRIYKLDNTYVLI